MVLIAPLHADYGTYFLGNVYFDFVKAQFSLPGVGVCGREKKKKKKRLRLISS